MNNKHRRDDNHKQILEGFRICGYTAFDISQGNHGAGDIIVGSKNSENWLFEIKTPGKEVLTPAEEKFISTWKGQHAVITTLSEGLAIINGRLPKNIGVDGKERIQNSVLVNRYRRPASVVLKTINKKKKKDKPNPGCEQIHG